MRVFIWVYWVWGGLGWAFTRGWTVGTRGRRGGYIGRERWDGMVRGAGITRAVSRSGPVWIASGD